MSAGRPVWPRLFGCRRCRRWLSARLDGELGPRKSAWLEAHLAACAECDRRRRELEAARRAFRGLHRRTPPSSFDEVLRQRLALEPPPAPRRARRLPALRPLAAGLALAAAGLALVWGLSGVPEPPPPVAAATPLAWPQPPATVLWETAAGAPLPSPLAEPGPWPEAPCASPSECGGPPPCASPSECGPL